MIGKSIFALFFLFLAIGSGIHLIRFEKSEGKDERGKHIYLLASNAKELFLSVGIVVELIYYQFHPFSADNVTLVLSILLVVSFVISNVTIYIVRKII